MRNAEERALALIEIVERGTYHSECQKKATLQCAIAMIIKEQDRDTRHACAEAILALPTCHAANGNSCYNENEDLVDAICKDAAHNACMNVKAC